MTANNNELAVIAQENGLETTKVEINYTIEPEKFAESIAEAEKLEDNQQMIEQLTTITKAKNELKDLLEIVEKHESAAKMIINARAKQLYGSDWQAIAGDGFKISRSFTGAVYTLNPDYNTPKKFLKIVTSVDAKAVDAYRDEKNKLPVGVELNPTRGESIRITIK